MKILSHLLIAATCIGASTAHAAIFNVSNLADSGAGSLRAAVVAANTATGAPHTINFASNLEGSIPLASEIIISNEMTINGSGAQRLSIDGALAHRLFRINLPNSTQSVSLTGMTLTRGSALLTEAGYGGAIYKARGNLRIVNSILSANRTTYRGGAIYSDSGAVTIENVTMSSNEAAAGSQSSGGAVYMRAGLFTCNTCAILNNKAEYGGGLALVSPGNHAVINNALIEGNTAIGRGGGIYSVTFESFRMSNSALISNTVANAEGGGFYFDGSTSQSSTPGLIENTTFHGNKAMSVIGTSSALAVSRGSLTVRNSTFSSNSVSPDAPSQRNDAAAIWVAGTDAHVKLISTLFDRNVRGGAGFADLARVATTSLPSTLDAANSLFRSDYNSSVITSQSAPNQFATDALALPLDRSIGLTPVVPVSARSPAIDRGVNPAPALVHDQRGAGFVRAWSDPNYANHPTLSKPDIGAYEYRADAILIGDFERR